jgi:type IV pilus assembly protein PilW
MNLTRARGFTLVEIMVSLAIAALLLSGIVQVFSTLKNTDRVSLGLSRVQEGGRVALDIISQDLRMAGFKGCADPNLAENLEIIALAGLPTDYIAASVVGFDVAATNWGDGTNLADIDGSGVANAIVNSDVISAMRFASESNPVTAHNRAGATITITGSNAALAANRFAAITDCSTASLFRVTGYTAGSPSSTVLHAASGNSSMSYEYASSNAELRALVSNAYFIGETGRTNVAGDTIHALFRRDINGNITEIVEGVENMQVEYGIEMIGGNRRFVPASTAGTNISSVTSIRVHLLVASNDRILESDDGATYVLGDVSITPASSGGAVTYANDRRLRKVFNLTINLRNRRVGV